MNSSKIIDKNKTGFDRQAFENLAKVETNYFWFRARNRLITWVLRRYFPHSQNFAEIGCGNGCVLSHIQEHMNYTRLTGIDMFAEGLAYASRIKNVQLLQMDIRQLPFKEDFDLIGAFDVLEHIDDDELALNKIHTALKKRGGLILTVPQHEFLWSYADELACHVRRYKSPQLTKKLQQAGFKVGETISFVSLLMPLVMGRLLIKGRKPQQNEMFWEFKLPGIINWTLEVIMRIELLFLKIGLRFPFGSSLLVVAYKE